MQKTLLLKSLIILVLMLLIAIPLSMIENTISSRIHYRNEAVRSIAADSVGEQTLLGPILVIPYSEHYEEEEVIDATEKTRRRVIYHQRVLNKRLFVFPNELRIAANIDNDHRYRGIHKVLVYSGNHELSGSFDMPNLDTLVREKAGSHFELGHPVVSLGLSDTRGLKNVPIIVWGGTSYEFQQDSQLSYFKHGIHAKLDIPDLAKTGSVSFKLNLNIDGIEQLAYIPIAKNNHVTLNSKWPHPQFFGRFLPSPKERKIDANGFSATWNISSLSSNAQQQLLNTECCQGTPTVNQDGVVGAAQAIGQIDSFGVAFIEPVNIYSQSDRAIKYGLLFVALSFAAFFLFEILKQLPIHPVQYTLVALALVLFFLLLVSLSEHMQFATAYGIASLACISLIGVYLRHALKSWKRGLGFATALTILYGVLFGLLQSENNALVMGSILLFSILATIMLVTRKIDWYQIGKANSVEEIKI